MRVTSMSIHDQCMLETKMLEYFDLLTPEWKGVTSASIKRHSKHFPQKAYDAISISQAFFRLADPNDPNNEPPIDVDEMILAIRYKLGYGWWAWFFFRNFAVPIIRWIWNEYHRPQPNGLFSTTSTN